MWLQNSNTRPEQEEKKRREIKKKKNGRNKLIIDENEQRCNKIERTLESEQI